jgi:hypothetical protein
VACMEEERKLYTILVGTSEGKRPLGRPGRRWDNWETGWGCVVDSEVFEKVPTAGFCEHGDSGVTELLGLFVCLFAFVRPTSANIHDNPER